MQTLDPPDEFVRRLAATARASRPTRVGTHRRRIAVAIATFLGASAVSVGGAWAVGVIEVPGVPEAPWHTPPVTPSSPGSSLEPDPAGPPGAAVGQRADRDARKDRGRGVERNESRVDEPGPKVRNERARQTPGRPDAPGEQGRGGQDRDRSDTAPDESGPPIDRGQGKTKVKDKGQGQGAGSADG